MANEWLEVCPSCHQAILEPHDNPMVCIRQLLDTIDAHRQALIGANWIISKLAPHEAMAISVRGYQVAPEDIAIGAKYRALIDGILHQEASDEGADSRSQEWQVDEQEARAELAAGLGKTFGNAQDAVEWLIEGKD